VATDYRIAAVIVLVVLAAAAYYVYAGGEPSNTNTQPIELVFEGEPANYTIALGPGSTAAYESMAVFHSANGTNVNATVNYTIVIVEHAWPFVTLNYSEDANRTATASFLTGNLAVPQELLGSNTICIPVSVPFANEGVCMRLTLVGEANGSLAYRGMANLSGMIVDALLYYDSSNGVLVESTFNITGPDGNLLFTHWQRLINYSVTTPVTVYTGEDWLCKPPLSSKAYLLWEGTYKLSAGPVMEAVPLQEVVDAVKTQGVIAVIAKDGRPLTDEFWQRILAAVDYANTSIYVVVVGPMASPDLGVLSKSILERAASPEYNVLIRFEGGRAVDVAYFFATPEDILALLSPG